MSTEFFPKLFRQKSSLAFFLIFILIAAWIALLFVVVNLNRMEQDQIRAYQGYSQNIGEITANVIVGKPRSIFELMISLSKLPDIYYLAFWSAAQRQMEAGRTAGLDARELAEPGDNTGGRHLGPFVYFSRPLHLPKALMPNAGTLQMVFSLNKLLTVKTNILAATAMISLSLVMVIFLWFQLRRVHGELEKSHTDVLETNRKLSQTQEELKAEQNQQAYMISVISHDAGNELEAIRASLKYLLSQSEGGRRLDPQVLDQDLRQAYTDSLFLDSLLSNLKDQKQAPETSVRLEAVEISELIEASRRSLESRTRIKKQAIRFSGAPGPHWVMADRHKLRRVLQNLLQNAIKFTRDGGKIEVWAEIRNAETAVFIQDEGPGIPSGDWEKIFEPYVRLNSVTPGTGLGLSISRRFVRQMNGELRVEGSTLGQGTTFCFALPSRP